MFTSLSRKVAITRTTNYAATDHTQPSYLGSVRDGITEDQLDLGRYQSYLDSVKDGLEHDRGLSFHMNRGAQVVRKTTNKWLPEDFKNEGYGVVIQYELKQGTCEVVGKEQANVSSTLTEDAVEGIVTNVTSRALSINPDQIRPDASFMDLGANSLEITEIAHNVAEATGGKAMNEICSTISVHQLNADTIKAEVTPQTLFRQPSVESLTSYLTKTLSRVSLRSGSKGEFRRTNSVLSTSQHKEGMLRSSSLLSMSVPGLSISHHESSRTKSGGVSIVGIGFRFPGASGPSQYWNLMIDGVNTSSTIPFGRWDAHSVANKSNLSKKEQTQVMWGSFVYDMEYFDATLFNISKSEAKSMSPLQRVLLDTVYLALLDAGFTTENIKGLDVGVFLGHWADSNTKKDIVMSVYSSTGTSTSIASGRISYIFDLQGPNIVYDTACSSSLVALHAATEALNNGTCGIALVVGANELFDSRVFESCARTGMLTPTGRCHTFDACADG